jgi:hypothetical protein
MFSNAHNCPLAINDLRSFLNLAGPQDNRRVQAQNLIEGCSVHRFQRK